MLELNGTLESVPDNPLILHLAFSMRIEFGEIWPGSHYSEAREICVMFKEGVQVRMKREREEAPSVLE